MKSINFKKLKILLLFSFIIIIAFNINILILNTYFNNLYTESVYYSKILNYEDLQNSAIRWSKSEYEVDWIKNSDFNSTDNWISEIKGDLTDIDTEISIGEAKYLIEGNQEINYEIISGIINNSLTSPGWINTTNPRIPVYPRKIATEPLQKITEYGCWTAHIWNESSGTPLNPFQKVSVQWDKNITLPDDMSDYIITTASLKLKVNATVRAYPGLGADPYDPLDPPWGGIEISGDYINTYFGEGDYIKFYVILSNLEKNISYTIAEYKPANLGTDIGQKSYDNITDTIFEPEDMEDLIFYLNQVLKTDYQNFIITVGLEINCEDNIVSDMDIFEDVYIKTCDFNISYVKKIDQLTAASWKYQGDKLESDKGIIEVVDSKLIFDYKINQIWPTDLSPNSEIKVFINNREYVETIKLSNAETSFKPIKTDGFDLTKMILPNEDINISIQVFLADEFGLGEEYIISIDNVRLTIWYNLYIQYQKSYLFEILLSIALIASGFLMSYFILYQKVLKFPKPVRKTRKYRFTLKKEKQPSVSIISRESAVKDLYRTKLEKSADFIKSTPSKTSIPPKSFSKRSKIEINKNLVIIFLILIMGLFLPLIFPAFNKVNYSGKENQNIHFSLNTSADPFSRKSYTSQWIKNSEFNTTNDWIVEYKGDFNDVNAFIANNEGHFEVLGYNGSYQWVENNPLSGEWKQIQNIDGIPLPQLSEMRASGWYVRHLYIDNALNQSVKAQWQKNFTVDIDMSDYYIKSASFELWINGTVENADADSGGIDRPGDNDISSGILQIATGDFARYSMLISDVNHEREFETVQYQTDDLGKDGPPRIIDLESTKLTPISEESLIFFLNQAFEKDSHQFAITLSISIWCEDSVYSMDRDFWNGLWIQNFTLSFSYEKKIDQFTSQTWKYKGERIDVDNYSIEIKDAKLYFDYKVNQTWPTDLSPNSEIKILINDQVYNETIKLSNAETFYKQIKIDGFDVTKLIPDNREINISIQIYLADEFALGYKLMLSIDNVELWISYDVLIPEIETVLFLILFILACIGAVILTAYIIIYQRILKYPRAVRKVRKYRKTLKKEKSPDILVINRETAFNRKYEKLLESTAFLTYKPIKKEESISNSKTRTLEEEIPKDKLESDQLIEKSIEKKEELDRLIGKTIKKD